MHEYMRTSASHSTDHWSSLPSLLCLHYLLVIFLLHFQHSFTVPTYTSSSIILPSPCSSSSSSSFSSPHLLLLLPNVAILPSLFPFPSPLPSSPTPSISRASILPSFTSTSLPSPTLFSNSTPAASSSNSQTPPLPVANTPTSNPFPSSPLLTSLSPPTTSFISLIVKIPPSANLLVLKLPPVMTSPAATLSPTLPPGNPVMSCPTLHVSGAEVSRPGWFCLALTPSCTVLSWNGLSLATPLSPFVHPMPKSSMPLQLHPGSGASAAMVL